MPEQSKAYEELEHRFRRIGALGDAESMLHWDLSTMMPAGGSQSRADQLATLRALRHGLLTAPDMADLLSAAAEDASLDVWEQANVREMRRSWRHATALTERQVEVLSRATTTCEGIWREARSSSDFHRVLAPLTRLLDLIREQALAKADALGLDPYDALLDEYEPDGRAADIDGVFADLSQFLPEFLPKVLERQAHEGTPAEPQGPFPIEKQREIAVALMQRLGFDFRHGRLDVSLHPFCGGTPDDVRITTRYDEADFRSALMGVMHETGHALYERGLPSAWRGLPVGHARGMLLHESQSLLIEMQVCRSRPFLHFATPLLRQAFGGRGPAWEAESLYRHYTRVEPGFIRVDADEVTYPAHVILRYNLERAMLAGDLAPAELPGAWNDGMEKMLGIRPPNDTLGCLQDIHWYDGAWGYFPTYTLGAMAAAQLFQAAVVSDTAIPDGIMHGDFAPLLQWLRTNVHGQGSLLSTRDLMTRATGRPLHARAFKEHLQNRYLD